MRPSLLFFALGLFLTAGCATSSGDQGEGGTVPAGGGEFHIRDYMETYLPREVYLAKFEIVAERGASLLYPTREEDPRQVGPGIHRLPRVPTEFVHAQRDRYVSQITGLLNQPPTRTTSVTILVVISDQPLNLEPFLQAPGGLRDLVGARAYTNDIWAVEQILGTVIPASGRGVSEHRIQTVSIPGAWSMRQ